MFTFMTPVYVVSLKSTVNAETPLINYVQNDRDQRKVEMDWHWIHIVPGLIHFIDTII